MTNNILLFADRSVITNKIRVTRFCIYIKDDEYLEMITDLSRKFRNNNEFAITLNILEK